jgi:hypothetical protein
VQTADSKGDVPMTTLEVLLALGVAAGLLGALIFCVVLMAVTFVDWMDRRWF